MSDGVDHAIASLVLAPVVAYGTFIRTYNPLVAIGVGAGCVFGIVMSPDLDINHSTYGENLLPGCVGSVWKSWWWLYGFVLPHRHWLSHAPIIGTLVRIVYAFWWIALIDAHWFVVLWPVWCGLALSDTAHWLMDKL